MKGRRLAAIMLVALVGGIAGPEEAVPLGSDDPRHTFARAGHPEQISACAQPGNTPAYGGYPVGGGCPYFGGPPGPLQGTFGWDYFGHPCWPHRVALGWCVGCRYKGGSGAYATEGCPIPNIFAIKLPERGHCPAGDP